MKKHSAGFLCFLSILVVCLENGFAENSTQLQNSLTTGKEIVTSLENSARTTERKHGIFPLDITAKGEDFCGNRLSYELKEEVLSSRLFTLEAGDVKKFVLQFQSSSEFPGRPDLASQYTIALVYQENTKTLPYYLEIMQGQVDAAHTESEIRKVLEWAYTVLKRYQYLLED